MVTAQDLADFTGRTLEQVQSVFDLAVVLVDEYVGDVDVPEAVLDRSYLLVGQHLYQQAMSTSGAIRQQFSTADGIPVQPARLARDPLTPAYPLLRKRVGIW